MALVELILLFLFFITGVLFYAAPIGMIIGGVVDGDRAQTKAGILLGIVVYGITLLFVLGLIV